MYVVDTIVAISTPPGRGAIGLIRLSGGAARTILEKLFRPRSPQAWRKPRTLYFGDILGSDGHRIDQGLSCWMPAPHSFTGEDVVEISCHGSPLVLRQVLAAALHHGARLARPGEFTQRAFLNGRIDLTQAEAIDELIRSQTRLQATLAADQLAGHLSADVERVREALIDLKSLLEVQIDFSDEEVSVDRHEMIAIAEGCRAALTRLVESYQRGRIIRDGVRVAIVGKPNVGKSSLLNALLGQNRAIVTDIAGTTRDIIEDGIDLDGIPVVLVDTAGLRDPQAADVVERIGMERAGVELTSADVVLVVVDGSMPLDEDDRRVLAATRDVRRLLLVNKSDQPPVLSAQDIEEHRAGQPALKIAAKRGEGLDELRELLRGMFVSDTPLDAGSAVVTQVRHYVALSGAEKAVTLALDALESSQPADLVAVDVQEAIDRIGEVTGVITHEDVLDRIFSRFCLGK